MNVQYISMSAPSLAELNPVREAGVGTAPWPRDCVIHWQSAFGLIVIETRGDQVFVNGDPVRPAKPGPEKDSA